jgi:Tol biopolymer transport system component
LTLAAIGAGLLTLVGAAPAQAAPRTELTSAFQGAVQVHGDSSTFGLALSGSGRFALFSSDDDALPGADGTRDIYLRDRKRDRTRLISRSSSGEPADESCSDDPAINADGRFIAFSCRATNLAGGAGGLFVHDARSGKTTLVSRTSQGDPASEDAEFATLSADGRYVAFRSNSDNMPGLDGTTDAYVRDRRKKRTTLVSRAGNGDPVDTDAIVNPSISANGRFVVFTSDSDLLPGAATTTDTYVRDLKDETTRLVSRTSAEVPASSSSTVSAGSISADGRFVVFESSAANLGASPNGSVILRDRERGRTKVISLTQGGDPAGGDEPKVSANGRRVVYESDDDDLPGTDGFFDVYRYERVTGETALASRSTSGTPGLDDSFYPSVSANGRLVAFSSRADNLSGADDDAVSNTFVRGPLP